MHPHDEKWVKEQFFWVPHHLRPKIKEAYAEVFEKEGRRAANTRLREYVQKITK